MVEVSLALAGDDPDSFDAAGERERVLFETCPLPL